MAFNNSFEIVEKFAHVAFLVEVPFDSILARVDLEHKSQHAAWHRYPNGSFIDSF